VLGLYRLPDARCLLLTAAPGRNWPFRAYLGPRSLAVLEAEWFSHRRGRLQFALTPRVTLQIPYLHLAEGEPPRVNGEPLEPLSSEQFRIEEDGTVAYVRPR
jgi:hypothetical protein